ncbi:DUF362 domain-containing protein [Chloroflexota bacterium]
MSISRVSSNKFVFHPPPQVSRARRVVIKPFATNPIQSPVTTSREILKKVITGIRRVSEADIIILEGNPTGESIQPVYSALGYDDFKRVLLLDVKDCIWVEVENPLLQPFAIPTFWIPNVLLSSDYLISIAPLKVVGNIPYLSIMNLISLLPVVKYKGEAKGGWSLLYSLGLENVIADLYFTLPFDLGIVDGTQKLSCLIDPTQGKAEDYGEVITGEPFETDNEVSKLLGLRADYLDLIDAGRVQLEYGTESST